MAATRQKPVENVPANFPQEALAAVEEAQQAAASRPAPEPAPTGRTPIPEAPYSITFKLQAPDRRSDMLVTARAATAKELTLSFAALIDQFLPVAEELGFVMPEAPAEPAPGQWPPAGAFDGNGAGNPAYAGNDYAGQPPGFPKPPGWQPPAPAPQAPAMPWSNGAPAPQGNGNGTVRGTYPLSRLVVASTRSGARQLQAYGPSGEKCTTGLSPDLMAQKCAALGLTAAHFQQTGVELFNAATMPGAPRVVVHWYQKEGTRYKDLDKLELAQ